MIELYQFGLAFVALLLGLFVWAGIVWSNRSRAQAKLFVEPHRIDFSTRGVAGYYVATTYGDRPLERVTAFGLGFAGRASVHLSGEGIDVFRKGEISFRIPNSALLDVKRTSVVIDKAVEQGGILSFRWRLGDIDLESHFRFASSSARDELASTASSMLVSAI